MIARATLAAALLVGLSFPCRAEDAPSNKPAEPPSSGPIRNAPSPRALQLAAYVFAASNVCGYKIGGPEFTSLLAKQNVKPEDVSPRGPFGNRVQGMFALMSNDMALHREESCLAVAGEYGPDGNIAKNVLQPMAAGEAPAAGNAPEKKPAE